MADDDVYSEHFAPRPNNIKLKWCMCSEVKMQKEREKEIHFSHNNIY